ncbi:TIGR04255 family protein [Corynebacterium qintianiae]|uniref:TIGR04255 family protein n=1 Tax=Corynebacterium qintianiae TaxID=2709392 RepID=A0A7T0KQA4_9CORY|nr:TIGR04255 family protein [Corynebacterium qintianiae]QPK84063.1 TIGR04255 family protein [Corynebacterium qintianiae]
MEIRKKYRPFTGDTNRKVRLDAAPLQLVIAQIQWPEHTHLNSSFEAAINSFSSELKGFPLASTASEAEFKISPEGIEQVQGGVSYQYSSADNVWTVHLNQKFISLSCGAYPDYKFQDVLDRLEPILLAVHKCLGIEVISRVGVRYVNRVEDANKITNLNQHFKSEALGYQFLDVPEGITLHGSLSQALYELDGIALNVRSGLMAPGQTPDQALAPLDKRAWALDLDAFQVTNQRFSPNFVMETVGTLSDTCYDFFKYVLLEAGETAFGGDHEG